MKPFRTLLAVMALIGLSGCFTSDKPLVSATNAVAPFSKMTFQGQGDDDKPATFTRDADGKTYVTTGGDGTRLTLLLMPIEGDYYVAQLSGAASGDPSAGSQNLYAYLHIDLANAKADAYRTFGDKKDVRPGLHACNDVICIDDLTAYIAYGREAIAEKANPDTAFKLTVEK